MRGVACRGAFVVRVAPPCVSFVCSGVQCPTQSSLVSGHTILPQPEGIMWVNTWCKTSSANELVLNKFWNRMEGKLKRFFFSFLFTNRFHFVFEGLVIPTIIWWNLSIRAAVLFSHYVSFLFLALFVNLNYHHVVHVHVTYYGSVTLSYCLALTISVLWIRKSYRGLR